MRTRSSLRIMILSGWVPVCAADAAWWCSLLPGPLADAEHPDARLPIVCAALIEKAALVLLIALNWNKPFGKGFGVTLLFDGACCVIYGLYLAGVA